MTFYINNKLLRYSDFFVGIHVFDKKEEKFDKIYLMDDYNRLYFFYCGIYS